MVKRQDNRVDNIEKLAAQYSASINDAQDLVASWMKKSSKWDEKTEDHGDHLSLKPLPSATAGLGSRPKSQNSASPSSSVAVASHSAKAARALESLKKKHQKSIAKEKVHNEWAVKPDSSDDDDEEDDVRKLSMKRKSQSFLDTYKSKKKKKASNW